MPEYRTETVNDLVSFITFIHEIKAPRWFRGVGNKDLTLVPGLYRHPRIDDAHHLIDQEAKALERFRQRSILYLEHSINNTGYDAILNTLFLMQHYGAPTRLLDWTENPLVALFFAMSYAEYSKDLDSKAPIYTSDPAVWILDPVKWNNISPDIDPPPGILNPSDPLVNSYIRPSRSGPITLYGLHNSRRIIAQSGVFVLFGTDNSPMEKIYLTKAFEQDTLIKLIIPKENVPSMFESLTNIGFGDATVFPDLSGLNSQLKRSAGYWMP